MTNELDNVTTKDIVSILEKEIGVDFSRFADKDSRLLAIDLKLRGLEIDRIYEIYKLKNDQAGLTSVTKDTLRDFLDAYTPTIDLTQIKVYSEYRKELFNKIENEAYTKLLNKIMETPTEDMKMKDIVSAFDKIVDKRRLEEDKATQKVESSHSIILDSLVKRRLKGEGKIVDV